MIPTVPKRYLLLLAGLIWLAAGTNILLIGVSNFAQGWDGNFLYGLLAIAVFTVFAVLIFFPMVRKHHTRIMSLPKEQAPIFQFLDRKSYIIMFFMMTGGLSLRNAHVAPPILIGWLYTGIGGALAVAGLLLILRFCRVCSGDCQTAL